MFNRGYLRAIHVMHSKGNVTINCVLPKRIFHAHFFMTMEYTLAVHVSIMVDRKILIGIPYLELAAGNHNKG